MKYTVVINENSKSITVDLDGHKGTAKCCPTDSFNLSTGIELALERAKVAKANAEKPIPAVKPMGVMELVKALEKALPKGQMVLVGNGEKLTAEQKKWLASIAGVSTKCNCSCCDCDEGDYESGYDDGYEDGYADALDECEECEDCEKYSDAMHRIVEILDEVGVID